MALARTRRTGAAVAACAALLFTAAPALAAGGWTEPVRSMPGFRIPKLYVTVHDDGTAPGYIFTTPRTVYPGRTGPTIFDANGHVVWFHRQSARLSAQNLEPQTYEGKPVLTWSVRPPTVAEGQALTGNSHNTYDVIADQSYHIIKRVRALGRGVITDNHDFVITSRNTALLLAARYAPHARVVDDLVQEIDLQTGQLIFNWSALRHIPLSESMLPRPKNGAWDAYHLNSVSEDTDGNLIVSSRHTSTVYKVDRKSGRIIWRLGGKHSSFRLAGNASFYYQHDAVRQPDGTMTLFDNHAIQIDRSHGLASSAKRLRLDMKHMTATLVRSYAQPPATPFSSSQGDADLLPNGDVFVGWGISPWLSEYEPGGRLLFSAHFASIWHHSYRAFKAPWVGLPTSSPAVYAATMNGRVTAFVSWNGATQVAEWRLLGGADAGSLAELTTVPWADFETRMSAPATPAVVRVQALDSSGNVIGQSPIVAPKQ